MSSSCFKDNDLNKAAVADFAGTAYLRERLYTKAISWFKKSNGKEVADINKNPFIDLVNDREEQFAAEKNTRTSKIKFATEMQRLMKQSINDEPNASSYFYKIATGLYNTTYYGHTWELVQYERSGTDGYSIPTNATGFQKEYYGCFAAHDYFEKAMNASGDKNFKAHCLFMMAKCKQKQYQQPGFSNYNYDDGNYTKAKHKYDNSFINNPYFTALIKKYGATDFYKEAYSQCSYLRDFVRRN